MSKGIRNTLIIIAIILLIFDIVCAIYMNNKTEPMDANESNSENILTNPDEGLENMINDIFEEPKEEENKVEEPKEEQTSSSNKDTEDEQSEINNDNVMTPKETKAINLVKEEWKKKWGSLDDVSFNVSIQNDGKYGVTVYDITTTQTIKFYTVDVDTGIVKEM